MDINNTALNNLLFFALGIAIDDSADTILNIIIEKAYNDATKQGAFNALISKDDEIKKKAKEIAKNGSQKGDGASSLLKNAIFQYEPFGSEERFFDWHYDLCGRINNIYETNGLGDEFSYGNAQKWLNMTLKYLLTISSFSYAFDEEVKQMLDKIFCDGELFYAPIDSYIIDELRIEKEVILPNVENISGDKNYKKSSNHVKGWSKWNEKNYKDTNDSLISFLKAKEEITFVWESLVWIKQSKKRRKTM